MFEDQVFIVTYGRPAADLPVALIKDLHKKGYSCRQIVAELAKIGIVTSKDTVNRRIKNLK